MKNILVTVLFLCTATAHAKSSLEVLKAPSPISVDPEIVTPTFAAEAGHPELRRAWVEVEVEGNFVSNMMTRETGYLKGKVDGLELDPVSKNITFKSAGAKDPVICATYKKGGAISPDRYAPTGHCKLSARVDDGNVDGGYQVHKAKMIVVDLVVE